MFRARQESANRYRYNGIEHNEELGLDMAFYRSYDPAIGRWMQVDPAASKYYSMTPYNGMGNNPILYSDILGDTLTGTSELSAQRALSIIQNSFGSNGGAMSGLFSLSSDGKTFNTINGGDFLNALNGLSTEASALAIGYYQSVNGSENNMVEVVKREEAVSDVAREGLGYQYKTGTDVDNFDKGGRYGDSSNFGGPNGSFAIIVMNPKVRLDSYSDGVSRSSLPGELLAHELLGHGPGGNYNFSDGSAQAVQMGNLYLRATGKSYHRIDHGASTPLPFLSKGIPTYFSPLRPRNLIPR